MLQFSLLLLLDQKQESRVTLQWTPNKLNHAPQICFKYVRNLLMLQSNTEIHELWFVYNILLLRTTCHIQM